MKLEYLNEIIENTNFDNSIAIEANNERTYFDSTEQNYDNQYLCNLEVLTLIKKYLCPVSFKDLLIHVSQFSYLLILCEEIGKYSKGML